MGRGPQGLRFLMAKRILDYDPFSRMFTTFDYEPSTDTTIIGREQDVSLLLDATAALRNAPEVTRRGIKNEWWHYAIYPNIVIEKWMNDYGVNVYDKHHSKKVFELTNRPEWKYLKTTTKMHWGKDE